MNKLDGLGTKVLHGETSQGRDIEFPGKHRVFTLVTGSIDCSNQVGTGGSQAVCQSASPADLNYFIRR